MVNRIARASPVKDYGDGMRQKKEIDHDWFIDAESENRQILHRVKRRVLTARTRFQNVELVDTDHLGRVVILDDKIQSAESDEFIYHEALVHPVMITHPRPENILILGGGEGASLREVLRHPSVLSVVMVDIDREFVSVCRHYLGPWHRGSFDNPTVRLVFDDAVHYVKESKQKFDVIIGDISDPVEKGPGWRLYRKEFYALLRNLLRKNGIFVTHATEVSCTGKQSLSKKIFITLKKIFPIVTFSYEYVPSFGALWSYVLCSVRHDPAGMSQRTLEKRIRERKLGGLAYYDAETHRRLFALPKCVRKGLSSP
ncbi:MAG: polyamine aminopropyltransferase [Nitrospirota bacterium]